MLANKVKRVMQLLQKLYKCGLLPYPRVDNNFIEACLAFDMQAHPKMCLESEMFSELEGERIPIDKNSALLFLSLIRVLSPSNIENFAEMLDDVFTDDLKFISEEKEKEVLKTFEMLNLYMEKNLIKQEDIISWYSEIFQKSQSREMKHFKIKNVHFILNEDPRLPKIIPHAMKEVITEETFSNQEVALKETLSDALEHYLCLQNESLESVNRQKIS